MFLNRFKSIFGYLFGQGRRLALCPVRARVLHRTLLFAAVALSARMTAASVLATGDFSPADNPFTTTVNEGMPTDGNFVNPFEAANHQTYFEGRHTDGANAADPTDDTNINFDVKVGITSSGTLLISGESALRDEDLIIGDRGTLNGQTRLGTGVVRITGFGSLYNNDPSILPAEVQNVAGFASQTPRPPNLTNGYDAYVGRWGGGTLEITAGARAEIQDAVLVGDNIGAVGNLVVDGIDSFLGNGGLPNATGNLPHQMIIGRQGTGNMTISTGATVDSEAPSAGGGTTNVGPIGAVLGSTPYSFTLAQVPDPGGSGTATVTGAGSKWTVGGSLQVGGFDIGLVGGTTVGAIEGNLTETHYNSQTGLGTLYVNSGAIVDVRNAIGVAPTDITTSLIVGVGRFGVVQLDGGTLRVGNVTGQANQATSDAVQVINDGVIRGTGRIDTGVFRNRYLGEVRVDAGQSLVITSTSTFSTAGGATPSEPLSNYGKIEVFGNAQAQASLEFVRAPSDPQNTSPVRPFINTPLIAPPVGGFSGGQISAQYANLHFGSGLENHSVVAFTAGTNNITGKVTNTTGEDDEPDGDGDDTTVQMLVSGPGTTAVFHDDLSFAAAAELNLVNGGNVVVLNQHSFTLAGSLSIALSYASPSLVSVVGDVGIGKSADLKVNLAADVLHSLKHGDAFEIISFGANIGNVNVTDPNNPVPDLTKLPVFSTIETSPNIKAQYGLDTVVEFAAAGVYVKFLNPAMVGSGAVAPDFNGDGVVDLADFAIWQAHAGITSGASVLEGDADGDGDVDGADFLKWQRNVGKPMPWVGAGSGVSAVPEPASLAMLICSGSLALAFGQRRAKR